MRLILCIPTYNRCAYLEDCLKSIQNQTFRDFHLVILDNASSQDYQPLLRKFDMLDIEYIKHHANIGAAENVKRALGFYAQSDYLMVFHDDDLMHPRLLEFEVRILEEHPHLSFVATEAVIFGDGEAPHLAQWGGIKGHYEIYTEVSHFARVLLQEVPLHFGSVLYRSRALKNVGPDLARFSIVADRPLLLDLARRGGCALIREPLVFYRIHAEQDSRVGQVTVDNLIELALEYRACFPPDWNSSDRSLFFRYFTKYLLYKYNMLPKSSRGPWWPYIRTCMAKGIIDWRFLNGVGFYAICRTFGIGWLSYLWPPIFLREVMQWIQCRWVRLRGSSQ